MEGAEGTGGMKRARWWEGRRGSREAGGGMGGGVKGGEEGRQEEGEK